jgi:hypothetical protein
MGRGSAWPRALARFGRRRPLGFLSGLVIVAHDARRRVGQCGRPLRPRRRDGRRWEAGHVEADLRDDDAGHSLAHARHRPEAVEGGAKGGEGVAQSRLYTARTAASRASIWVRCSVSMKR